MSVALGSVANRAFCFYEATIGKKVVMAVTGAVLFGYVVGHLIGNLQIYAGPEVLNEYGAMLHSRPALLWTVRVVLLVSLVLHVVAAIQIAQLRNRARPLAYRNKGGIGADFGSRNMIWTGLLILAFVVYHLLHFTFGSAHPAFQEGDVFHNVVAGFQVWPVSVAYIVAMLLLGVHLYHGIWSMFQSLGLSNPAILPKLKRAAAVLAILIVVGNISIPIAVLTGRVHL